MIIAFIGNLFPMSLLVFECHRHQYITYIMIKGEIVFIIAGLIWLTLRDNPAVPSALVSLRWLADPGHYFTPLMMWIALVLTVLSGFNYMRHSVALFREKT